MVVLILSFLLLFSIGFNIWHLRQITSENSLRKSVNDQAGKIKLLEKRWNRTCELWQIDRDSKGAYILELQHQLKESEANRELKGKRINELMSVWSKIYDINAILKEDNKELHQYKELYLKY